MSQYQKVYFRLFWVSIHTVHMSTETNKRKQRHLHYLDNKPHRCKHVQRGTKLGGGSGEGGAVMTDNFH